MVDGVLASCFAGCHHDLVHLGMTPMQKFSMVMAWIFGNDDELAVYVSTARQLGWFLMPATQYWND